MPVKLELNRDKLWDGCILAGIAHAIMVAKYPLMANEQSWDGLNYSVQDSSGQRGTVSFKDNCCVAAFRNDNSVRMRTSIDLKRYFEGADEFIMQLAHEETLQYLLDEVDGEVTPIITTAFWGREELVTNDTIAEMLVNGGNLIKNQVCDIPMAIQHWKDVYEMSDKQVDLMNLLYKKKKNNLDQLIKLSKEEVNFLGTKSEEGMIECKESFAEMNIFWD